MKFWHIKSALKWMKYRLKHPVTTASSSDWSTDDHQHICLVARLLERDDFERVCPCNGKCEIELDDRCDRCPYMSIVRFNKDSFCEKWISLYPYIGGEYDPFKQSVELHGGESKSLLLNLPLSSLRQKFSMYDILATERKKSSRKRVRRDRAMNKSTSEIVSKKLFDEYFDKWKSGKSKEFQGTQDLCKHSAFDGMFGFSGWAGCNLHWDDGIHYGCKGCPENCPDFELADDETLHYRCLEDLRYLMKGDSK